MGATLDDAAVFNDQDLVRAANGGEAVRDDEGGAAAHQVGEALLNQGFGFGIEAGGGFVKDEDAGIGENGAGDGDALALTSGKPDAALADDGVVLVGEGLGKFVDAGDAAGGQKIVLADVGPREHDVVADGAVEQERYPAERRRAGVR